MIRGQASSVHLLRNKVDAIVLQESSLFLFFLLK